MDKATGAPAEPVVLSPADTVPTSMNQQTLLIASLFLAILFFSVWMFARRKSQVKGTALLLLGPSDAGKTAILTTLAYTQTLATQTSMQTNSSVVTLPDLPKPLRVIDVPGHPRVRNQFREHMNDAKAILFVVDANNVSRNGAAVAEHLHSVLNAISTLPPSVPTPPLLILAHKADLLKTGSSSTAASNSALAVNRVRTVLERELDKRRASHAGGVGMESLGDEGKGDDEGDLSGEGGLECNGSGEFKFAEWEGGEVAFVGSWVKVGEKVTEGDSDGLEELREWIHALPA